MLELLLHVINLQTTPTGESVPAPYKIILLKIIVEGGGEALVIDPPSFCPLVGITHVKSLPRLLRRLAELQLITLEKGRGKDGKWVSSVAYPLPGIKREPVTVRFQSNTSVTGPVTEKLPDQESGNQKVTGLSVEAAKDLRLPGNQRVTGSGQDQRGTVIAFISPSQLDNNKRIKEGEAGNSMVTGLLAHPAVRVWLEIMQEDIAVKTAEYISKRVEYVELWRETLEGWQASRWSNTNVTGQVERYQKAVKNYTPPEEMLTKVKDPVEDERIRRRMYGGD